MNKKTRQLLFYAAFLLFIVISFLTVVFALGYQYDFVQNKFLKTGSLELKINIPADVYINEELAGDTSFLGNYFSKGRLLPRTYNLRVEKEGYQTWQKLAKIEAGFLTNFPKIVLFPEEFKEEVLASSSLGTIAIKTFDHEKKVALFANRRQLEAINLQDGEVDENYKEETKKKTIGPSQALVSPDGSKKLNFSEREIWVEWVRGSDYQPFRLAGDVELVARFTVQIKDVQWYKDSEHLLVSTGGILKFVEIDTRDALNIFDITALNEPFYYDKDQDAVFKFDKNELVRIRLSE